MTGALFGRYGDVFRNLSFRRFWGGFALSSVGDAMTRVALIWFVYQLTGSPRALGLLSVCYTGPILIGGLVAGSLLDRFDRRNVMIADNLIRGVAVALIPLLHALGRLELWHLYTVAAVYGLFMMISLAGGPSLLPSLVSSEQLITVNALEMLGFTMGGIVGPPLAGLLIPLIGAPNVLIVDAISYGLFALALSRVHYTESDVAHVATTDEPYRLADAFHLLRSNNILLSTTLMFMAYNVGQGFLFVWLPIYASRSLGGGAMVFGALLGAVAVGELLSSILAGSLRLPLALGTLICLFQFCAGVVLLPLLADNRLIALAGMSLYGFFSAPLTIWAQTLRMGIIPERLRGRTFALLRMLMQGTGPVGGALAGFLLPLLGVQLMINLTGTFTSLPGIAGYQVRQLRDGGEPSVPLDELPQSNVSG
ncbi:MAG TPA: MFS transporter [Nitrolancea sp.]